MQGKLQNAAILRRKLHETATSKPRYRTFAPSFGNTRGTRTPAFRDKSLLPDNRKGMTEQEQKHAACVFGRKTTINLT